MQAKYLTFIGTMLTLAMTGGAAFAQSSQPVQPQQSQPQPQVQPSPQTEVSQADLQKFANAVKKLQPIQLQAQTQVTQIIQKSNLSEKRFGEIYQAQQNPQAQPAQAISPDESQKFKQATAKIQEIQQSTQTQMEQAVQKEGLDIKRFNEIFVAVRQNPTLLQKVRQMIQS